MNLPNLLYNTYPLTHINELESIRFLSLIHLHCKVIVKCDTCLQSQVKSCTESYVDGIYRTHVAYQNTCLYLSWRENMICTPIFPSIARLCQNVGQTSYNHNPGKGEHFSIKRKAVKSDYFNSQYHQLCLNKYSVQWETRSTSQLPKPLGIIHCLIREIVGYILRLLIYYLKWC